MADMHPFERAGLGQAPFRFVGIEHKTYQAHPDAPIQVGGSCDYCGTGISYHCHVQGADGRRFKVGCDCVLKVESARAECSGNLAQQASAALARAKKVAAKASLATRIGACKAALAADCRLLASVPHQHPGLARSGKTMRDSVAWLFEHAGAAGKIKACQIVERAQS